MQKYKIKITYSKLLYNETNLKLTKHFIVLIEKKLQKSSKFYL